MLINNWKSFLCLDGTRIFPCILGKHGIIPKPTCLGIHHQVLSLFIKNYLKYYVCMNLELKNKHIFHFSNKCACQKKTKKQRFYGSHKCDQLLSEINQNGPFFCY